MHDTMSRRGWVVTLAGTGINLALGILYTWSVIKKGIPPEWGWGDFERSLPYSVALLVFAFATVLAGRLQDTLGAALGRHRGRRADRRRLSGRGPGRLEPRRAS